MNIEDLIKKHLPQANIMQLATAMDNQPWTCNLHYYSDKALNLYWVSTEERRHSQDIKGNSKVAAAILIHENTADENYVIGISIEGTAELIGKQVEEQVGNGYIQKHAKDPSLLTDIASGKNPHKFYRLKPSRIVLFDTKNLKDNPRQEWQPNK